MAQASDDATTTEDDVVVPLRPDTQARPKDPTSPIRSKRYRRRKQGAKRDAKRDAHGADQQSNRDHKNVPGGQTSQAKRRNEIKAAVTVHDAPPLAPNADARAPAQRHGRGIDVTAYTAAIALAGAAAWFSIRGMVVLFPGSPKSVVVMAIAMETAKLVTAGWLARRWSATAVVWRLVLIAFVLGLAAINATGVYAQLVSAHVGERGAAQSDIEMKDAALAAKIEMATHNVADLDRRLNQVDTAIEEAAKRGRTKTAIDAIETQRRARAALVDERKREAAALVVLQTERASVAAQGRKIETEAAPIRYVAELLGIDTDSEKAIRWLIALMVLCCDPLAIALTAAASARQ